MANISDASLNISVLEDMFMVANKEFYNNSLSNVQFNICTIRGMRNSRVSYNVITLPDGRNKSEFSIDGSIVSCTNTDKIFQEVLRCCYILYAHQNELAISTRGSNKEDNKKSNRFGNGYYYNDRFLKYSNNKGIIIGKHKTYHYEVIGIDEKAKALINKYNWCLIPTRDKYVYGKNPMSNSKKHQRSPKCPYCGVHVQITKNNYQAACVDCIKKYLPEVAKQIKPFILQ